MPITANTRLVVVVSIYNPIHADRMAELVAALANPQRPDLEIVAFLDGCRSVPENLQTFTTAVDTIRLAGLPAPGVDPIDTSRYTAVLNPESLHHSTFASAGLSQTLGEAYSPITHVPAHYALYTQTALPMPAPALVDRAVGLFIPKAPSNGGQGACLFLVGDVSVFNPAIVPLVNTTPSPKPSPPPRSTPPVPAPGLPWASRLYRQPRPGRARAGGGQGHRHDHSHRHLPGCPSHGNYRHLFRHRQGSGQQPTRDFHRLRHGPFPDQHRATATHPDHRHARAASSTGVHGQPQPAGQRSAVTITCVDGHAGDAIGIPGCTFAPATLDISGKAACTGTAGTGAYQVNDNLPVTVTDPGNGLSNSGTLVCTGKGGRFG